MRDGEVLAGELLANPWQGRSRSANDNSSPAAFVLDARRVSVGRPGTKIHMPLVQVAATLGDSHGQGWAQVGELALAIGLSSLIGLERELTHKAAGLRTQTLVGLGAAVFVLVSKYGFFDVLEPNRVVLDPSRVAAQIVTGIGFIGAGLIFVHRDSVKGLTTAATVWLTAAVGAASGAGLWLIAIVATAMHLAAIRGLAPVSRRLRARPRPADSSDED
jgi:hypothetical protein